MYTRTLTMHHVIPRDVSERLRAIAGYSLLILFGQVCPQSSHRLQMVQGVSIRDLYPDAEGGYQCDECGETGAGLSHAPVWPGGMRVLFMRSLCGAIAGWEASAPACPAWKINLHQAEMGPKGPRDGSL